MFSQTTPGKCAPLAARAGAGGAGPGAAEGGKELLFVLSLITF